MEILEQLNVAHQSNHLDLHTQLVFDGRTSGDSCWLWVRRCAAEFCIQAKTSPVPVQQWIVFQDWIVFLVFGPATERGSSVLCLPHLPHL